MGKVLLVLAPIILAVGVGFIFSFLRKDRERKKEGLNRRDFVVHSSYVWGILMIMIGAFLLSIIVVTSIFDPLGIGMIIFLSLIVVLLAIGSVQMLRERVHVIDKEIIYTPAIGKKRRYSLDDIEKVEYKRTGYYVYINGKRVFSMETGAIGASLFYEIARFNDKEASK